MTFPPPPGGGGGGGGDPSTTVVVIIGIITAVVVIASIVYVLFSVGVAACDNSDEKKRHDVADDREGFFESTPGGGDDMDIDVDQLNEYRGVVREAFAVVLDRYPTKDEQSVYIRLLANDQTSFVGIMKELKGSDEYVKTKTNLISDPLPPPTKSIVKAEEDREASAPGGGGDRAVLRRAFRDRMDREASDEELSCMYDKVRSGKGASTGEAIAACANTDDDPSGGGNDDEKEDDPGGGREEDGGYTDDGWWEFSVGNSVGDPDEGGGGDGKGDGRGVGGGQRGEARTDMSATLSDLDEFEGEERREMEDTVRRVYAKVHGGSGHATTTAPQGDRWAPPAELNQQTLDMWIAYLWKDDKDATKLERRMRALQRASRGFPVGGGGSSGGGGGGGYGGAGDVEARLPAGMDTDPYASAYALDADMLGDELSDEERERRKRAYAKQRAESYGVGTRYGSAKTAEEALIMRSRRMDAAELAEKREEDRRRFLRR